VRWGAASVAGRCSEDLGAWEFHLPGYNAGMFLRPCYRTKNGKRHAYWALMESYRTARGPRQRVVAYLGPGQLDQRGRLGVKDAAVGGRRSRQKRLFDDVEPEWVEVDAARLRVENSRDFGGPWLGLELVRQIGLHEFLQRTIPCGDEHVPWSVMALVLVLCRLCEPSSELHVVEHFYATSGLAELLGVPAEKINQQRMYRALDALLPHKEALEMFLKSRLGELFGLEYDLLLYDVTSTYFEGEARGNDLAQRGYSRDHRPDCKQVCIGLVVSKCGMPLGYEVFAGNRADVTTLQEIVQTMERRYGRADRIWVTDRGMISEENMHFLQQEGRRYLVGTPKSMLKRFGRELLAGDWREIRDGVEVKLCPSPEGAEMFVLCRSRDRREKEKAMHARFEQRIDEGLRRIEAACRRQRLDRAVVGQRIGRLLGQNSRAAGLFQVEVHSGDDGRATLRWQKVEAWRDWAALSEGCYLLRTNITDWTDEDLWKTYIQLTEAEAAFRVHKSDLSIRPIWHQKKERVLAHILVCFLAYVLWKTLGQNCQRAGLGQEPRRVFEELGKIRLVDVVLPTRPGIEIRRRCITRPTDHQAILLQRLRLQLPTRPMAGL
jgi:transposase